MTSFSQAQSVKAFTFTTSYNKKGSALMEQWFLSFFFFSNDGYKKHPQSWSCCLPSGEAQSIPAGGQFRWSWNASILKQGVWIHQVKLVIKQAGQGRQTRRTLCSFTAPPPATRSLSLPPATCTQSGKGTSGSRRKHPTSSSRISSSQAKVAMWGGGHSLAAALPGTLL